MKIAKEARVLSSRKILLVQLPYVPGYRSYNRTLLTDILPAKNRTRIKFDGTVKAFSISPRYFRAVVNGLAHRGYHIEVTQIVADTEFCDVRCADAKSDWCTCKCEGRFHAQGDSWYWTLVSETTLVQQNKIERIYSVGLSTPEYIEVAETEAPVDGSVAHAPI